MNLKQTYQIPLLPLSADVETRPILKAAIAANRTLAELKGKAATMPNPGILIDTLAMQEARASSEIENIVTTQDEIFQFDVLPLTLASPEAKEVANYRDALRATWEHMQENSNLITANTMLLAFQVLKNTEAGFRDLPGTALKNEQDGSIVYVPPQEYNDVITKIANLELYINDNSLCDLDPIIKMAIIHHQFESIHPFYDGNGRIGRILNVLYLEKMGLLDAPILYLSRYITNTKRDYYRLLQSVRDTGDWENWILYILTAVAETAVETTHLIESIRSLMAGFKHRLRRELPKIYSQDLINNVFRHPYTKIEFLERDLKVTRQTASRYLEILCKNQYLSKHKIGTTNYYMNGALVKLFSEVSD